MSELLSEKPLLLLYLHGFLSSPQSYKCRLLEEWLVRERPHISFRAPLVSPHPAVASAELEAIVDECKDATIGLVGSSMGGFYASLLAERHGLRAVVVNPAVHPARFMPAYLGQQLAPYSGEPREYRLDAADVDNMRRLEAELQPPLRGRYWLLAQRGDETLDCREAEAFYRGHRQTVESGGDHAFQGFERYCEAIVDFLFTAGS
ncbi:YqiA/YcfP family alpha/beta fold hydrolase [Microbulbifer sediminum]|uniref:YqiA/YcfP family alpha/beta fold hydrolase n=1 Tax=Microbulbifer sediminum TaxID=2904250 RepID=UPI001F1A0ACF|nr:YqiA/YcfP family alpha/beta fold hydrolase [Microbulbifer sediminum]